MRIILICNVPRGTWGKTENRENANFSRFFSFLRFFIFCEKIKKSLTKFKFWRGGASSKSTTIFSVAQKRVNASWRKVVVYFQQSSKKFVKIGAGAPVVVRR